MKTVEHAVLQRPIARQMPLGGAYVILLAFSLIYFSRPEDWIPSLAPVPLAKITGILAFFALLLSLPQIRQRLPREVILLSLFIMNLFLASALSPVWRGGAFQVTFDLAKVLIVVVVMALALNDLRRLQRFISTQAGSVAVIAAVSLWKGDHVGNRLVGTLGGIYADPNYLALAMCISIPLCFGLSLLNTGTLRRAFWILAMLVMAYSALRTGSRGGFLSLAAVVMIGLWVFAIRGRRGYLLVLAALAGVILWQSASGALLARLSGTLGSESNHSGAYESALQRQQLLLRSLEVTFEHPFLGIGPGNFGQVSGNWHTAHNSFTLVSSEGGLPALLLYLWILWCGFANLRKTNKLVRWNKEFTITAGALLASLVGYLVGSFFLSVAYEFFPYILVAYTTVLLSIAKRTASQSRNRQPVREERSDLRVLETAQLPAQ